LSGGDHSGDDKTGHSYRTDAPPEHQNPEGFTYVWVETPGEDDVQKPDGIIKAKEGEGGFRPPMDNYNDNYPTTRNKLNAISVKNNSQQWQNVRNEIFSATQDFQNALGQLENGTDPADGQGGISRWKGKTHDAAIRNLQSSFSEPFTASSGAETMATLTDDFAKTITNAQNNVNDRWSQYESDRSTYPELTDEIDRDYAHFAQTVMRVAYDPNIKAIGSNNPTFTTGGPPDVGDEEPGDPRDPRSEGDGGGVPPYSGGGGVPKMPDFGGRELPTRPSSLPTLPTGPDDPPPTGPEGLPTGPQGDPTQSAPAAPPTGVGSPTQAANAAQKPNAPRNRPPEGALRLGPQGQGGQPRKGGGAGGGGGVGGAGRPPLSGRPASAQTVAAGRAVPAPAAPGAGLGSGAGVPPMAPPVAGQRGGDANGKGHQTMKALRRKKTGEQVMGEADAVVPVVGEPEKPGAAQREADADQPDRHT
jgi:hypothetical protein